MSTQSAKHASDEESLKYLYEQTIHYLVNYTYMYLSSLLQSRLAILHCDDVIIDILYALL